jgi:hypothetical protein
MGLPIQQTKSKDLQIMQTTWSNQLNPVVANPLLNGRLIKDIVLKSGVNSINHGLGRPLQGWIVTGMHNVFVQLYDTQSSNQMPQLTLQLNSNGVGNIDLYVF